MTVTPRELAAAEVAAERFAGVSWQVAQGDTVLDCDAVGFSDHQLTRPMRTDAIVRIYSMTKPIVSILALMLVEEGRLALSDRVSSFFKDYGAAGVLDDRGKRVACERPATIEDLLMHRAGLSYDFMPDCAVSALYRDASLLADASRPLHDLALELSCMPLAKQPGRQWYYSYGTDVLAAIVQLIIDKPLIDGMRERVLDPLEMADTHFGVHEGTRDRLADMFGINPLEHENIATGRPQTLEPMDVERSCPSDQLASFARGGHGLFSTLRDYAAFNRFLCTGRDASGRELFPQHALNAAWVNRLPLEQRPIAIADRSFPGYGWGLFGRVMTDVEDVPARASLGEGGWSGAASTWFWVDRLNDFSGIVFTQYLGAEVPIGELMQRAAYAEFCR